MAIENHSLDKTYKKNFQQLVKFEENSRILVFLMKTEKTDICGLFVLPVPGKITGYISHIFTVHTARTGYNKFHTHKCLFYSLNG